MKPFFASIPLVLALVFTTVTGVFLVEQNIRTHRTDMESRAFQIMTGVVERYGGGGSFDPQEWEDLVGLGLYDAQGNPVYRYGTAPALLPPDDLGPGYFSISGASITVIRKTGVVPGLDGPGFMRGRRLPMHPRMPGRSPGLQGTMPMHHSPVHMRNVHTIFMELDATSLHRQAVTETGLIALSFAVFLGAVALVFRYSRKLASYREREQKNAYLVQLGEAARTLAHEIKNPLGVIRVQCATLERSLPESFGRNLGIIREETDRLAVLTERLRDFLRTGAGTPQMIGLTGLLEQFRERYGESLAVSPFPDPAVCVYADPGHVTQMLDNLISNAHDASPENVEHPELSVSVDHDMVRFRILDRGNGIPDDIRAQIFELFFTTKTQGSGLGLALVKRLAEMNNGSVGFRNRHGGGSEFWIALPARRRGGTYDEQH